MAIQVPGRDNPSLHPIKGGDAEGLLALLCRGKTPLAQIQGTMPPPAAPDDHAFIAFARQMLRDLAPRWAGCRVSWAGPW